jgi:cob(I)alamin adenosyltransferase
MSKYLAYSFLYDDAEDLKCDFELFSDEIASMIGFLRSLLGDAARAAKPDLADELQTVNELMYHINPSLRTKVMVTADELAWLLEKTAQLNKAAREGYPPQGGLTFFVPQGTKEAAQSHLVRCRCKMLVRLLSRYRQQGNDVDELLFDFVNVYSGYFYSLALWFNKIAGVKEIPFKSRVYA